jgi:hypothetical protein
MKFKTEDLSPKNKQYIKQHKNFGRVLAVPPLG